MKKIVSILFLCIFFLHLFSKIFIYLDFKINQDYIAQNLCVMKNMQNNTCQGNCQLTKRLDKETREEQKQLPQKNREKQDILYFQNNINSVTGLIFYTLEKTGQKYHYDFSEGHTCFNSIFRPPKFI